ncbi:MAG: deoxyribonuclease IV [Phycisphaerae bacterium]|nr:deoxyribonuclease IV [Phycisphaerae bacterium]
MSIAGGLHQALVLGRKTGCNCIQIFVKNQRQWHAPPLTQDQVQAWQRALAESDIRPVIAHSTYLINLASPYDQLWQRSINAFTDELERCERLGITALVIHPGAHLGQGVDRGIARVAQALNAIHARTRGFTVKTTLETTAGQGSCLGSRLNQLAAIIEQTREPDRIRVCVDTCHIFAAGYDLSSAQGYAATMADLTHHIGLGRIVAFHLNDSLSPIGCHKDRHEHIGRGHLGRSAFRHLLNDPRFLGRPMILETPKGQDSRGRDLDRVNLATLRRLVVSVKTRPTGAGKPHA